MFEDFSKMKGTSIYIYNYIYTWIYTYIYIYIYVYIYTYVYIYIYILERHMFPKIASSRSSLFWNLGRSRCTWTSEALGVSTTLTKAFGSGVWVNIWYPKMVNEMVDKWSIQWFMPMVNPHCQYVLIPIVSRCRTTQQLVLWENRNADVPSEKDIHTFQSETSISHTRLCMWNSQKWWYTMAYPIFRRQYGGFLK